MYGWAFNQNLAQILEYGWTRTSQAMQDLGGRGLEQASMSSKKLRHEDEVRRKAGQQEVQNAMKRQTWTWK